MKSFKTWLEDYDPGDDIPGGSHKFEIEEIGYVDDRPAIPGLPPPTNTGENEVYQVVYDLGYEMTPGMKGYSPPGERQSTPDDPDEYKITHNDPVEVNHEKLDENHPILKTFNITLKKLKEILVNYFDWTLHDEALERVEEKGV